MRWLKKSLVVLLLAGQAVVLTGCSDQDWRDLVDLARRWAKARGVMDENGNVNTIKLGIELYGEAGEYAGPIMSAGSTVDGFQKGEAQASAGVKDRDPEKVGAAINMRPKEFRYNNMRGAIYLSEGKEMDAVRDFNQADAKADQAGKAAPVRNLNSRVSSLMAERDNIHKDYQSKAISGDVYKQRLQVTAKYLAQTYTRRFQMTGNPDDQAQAAKYKAQAESN